MEKKVAPTGRNNYTGNHVVFHQVVEGESLSKIAELYGFQNYWWEPIWNFNRIVGVFKHTDYNYVQTGITIGIPRSLEGYDKLIRKLRTLKIERKGSGVILGYQLEGLKDEFEAQRVLWDFAGDVATLLATLPFKAQRAASAAKNTSGNISALKMSMLKGIELAKEVNLLGTSVEFLLGKFNETIGKFSKTAIQSYPVIKKVGTKKFPFIQLNTKSILDITEILLDYVSVSKVADLYTLILYGETVNQSIEKSGVFVKRQVENDCAVLDQKINKYEGEKSKVYGSLL